MGILSDQPFPMGASLSLHAGLDGVTALSAEEYVERAVALANDRPRLRELRASLRQLLAASPVCDGPGVCPQHGRRLPGHVGVKSGKLVRFLTVRQDAPIGT